MSSLVPFKKILFSIYFPFIFATIYTPYVVAEGVADPFMTVNRNPFVQIFGLPTAQSAQLLAPSKTRASLQLEVASNFTINNSGTGNGKESIVIDGETHHANLQLRHGITNHFEFGLDIPYLSHEGGDLDGFINDWHDFFALPDGGRPDRVDNQLQYTYQGQGANTAAVNVNNSSDGIGDVSVSLGYQFATMDTRQWALRAGVKLPTGEADTLTGSGSTDAFFSVNVSDQSLLKDYNLSLHASTGALWMNDSDVLNVIHKDWVLFGSSTLSWNYNPILSFKAQIDFHSAFYDSQLKEIGDSSAQLILGGAVQLSDRWKMDISVSEDIVVDTASDVVFQVGVTLMSD